MGQVLSWSDIWIFICMWFYKLFWENVYFWMWQFSKAIPEIAHVFQLFYRFQFSWEKIWSNLPLCTWCMYSIVVRASSSSIEWKINGLLSHVVFLTKYSVYQIIRVQIVAQEWTLWLGAIARGSDTTHNKAPRVSLVTFLWTLSQKRHHHHQYSDQATESGLWGADFHQIKSSLWNHTFM